MTKEKNSNPDELTSYLGDYTFFQGLIVVLLSVSVIPSGYHCLIVVFLSDTPEHRCKASIDSTCNGTDVKQSSWIGPDSCSRYKVNRSCTETERRSNDTEQCVDGWVFSTESYISTIVSEWDLVCEDAWKAPFSTSLFYAGALIGSLISGILSDRFGRKPMYFLSMVLQPVTALIQASSANWVMFCVLNCLRGVFQMSYMLTSLVLGAELLSQSVRVNYTLLGHNLGHGIGYALLPLLAYLTRGWRMLLVASAFPCFLFIPLWWVIPESPRWLLQKGRVEEAELVIRKAAKISRVPAPEVIFRDGLCLELMKNEGEEEQKYTYVDLIRTRNMRNITILGSFIWQSVCIVYFGLSLNTGNMHGNVFLNCFISAAIDILAYVVSRLLINRVAKPTLLFSLLMLSGTMLLIIKLVPEDMHTMLLVLASVGKMGVCSGYCLSSMYFTALFPTVVRNMGLGITFTAGKIGNIICPFVIYMGMYNKVLPYIVFGTVSIMAAIVSILLPDIRNGELPDLISQVKPIRCFCSPKEKDIATQTYVEAAKKSTRAPSPERKLHSKSDQKAKP